MKVRIWFGVLLALLAGTAMAQSAQQVRKQAEASMVVTGHVDIEADGSVSAHVIDHREKLPDYVVSMVDRAAQTWRFEPILVDGQPVPARARMSLRLLAQPIEGGTEYRMSIANGSFGEDSNQDTDRVRRGELKPPSYPPAMLYRGVEGTAYLLLKIGRDGRVEDAVAERVNLRGYDNEREMERMRRSFATRSINAARGWTFVPPTTGKHAGEEYWTVRVPVEYDLSDPGSRRDTVGKWELYVPGPRQPEPDWLRSTSSGSDAMLAGQIQMVGNERRLLTPLEGS